MNLFMQPSRVFVITCIALLLCLDNSAQTTSPSLSLKQAVETAIANNTDVKTSGFALERQEVNWRQSKENLLPTVSGSIQHYSNQGRNIDYATNSYVNQQYTSAQYNLNGNLTVFNGLRLLNLMKGNEYAYESDKMAWQQSKDRVMLQVMLAYLQVLTATDLLEQAKKQLATSQGQVH
jgi:outer membrane protein